MSSITTTMICDILWTCVMFWLYWHDDPQLHSSLSRSTRIKRSGFCRVGIGWFQILTIEMQNIQRGLLMDHAQKSDLFGGKLSVLSSRRGKHGNITPRIHYSLRVKYHKHTITLRVTHFTVEDQEAPYMIWVFPKIGVPQNGWFMMENAMNIDDLGVPLFSETPNMSISPNPSWIFSRCFFWTFRPPWAEPKVLRLSYSKPRTRTHSRPQLVGGFFPSEEYYTVKMGSSSPNRGRFIKKIFELPPPSQDFWLKENMCKMQKICRKAQSFGCLHLLNTSNKKATYIVFIIEDRHVFFSSCPT